MSRSTKGFHMKKRARNISIHIYLTEEEHNILEQKFRLSGKSSKSDFIRQMILTGFVFDIDFSEIHRNNYLLSNISGNINQIAHRINETRSIFQSDIDQLKKEMEKLWQLQKSTLSMLPSEKQ